jgi:outer membrane protein assembly factor BamA
VRWFSIVLFACHGVPAPHPPLTAGCSPSRVGRVIVEGAAASEVAPLAVLEGTLDDPPRTARIADVAAELLRARGYSRATVAVTRVHGCGVELHVAVARGPRYRIAELLFAGAPEPPAVDAVADTLGTINAVGGAYLEDRMLRALGHLARRYRDAGWLDVAIEPPVAAYDDRAGTVRVTISIRAGRRFRIGSVTAHGAGAEAVLSALGLRGGDWYDASRLRDGIARARRELSRRIEVKTTTADDRIDLEAIVGDPR